MLPRFAVGPLAVILTVPCAWPGHARAERPRVIVPEAAKTVSRAFERMRPTLELRGANIDRDHVIATLCGAGAMAAGLAQKRLRRWMRGATPVFVTALAAPVLATLAALAAPVGLWDALLGALSMGAAFLFVGHAAMAQRGVRLTLIASCVVSAALAEGAVRVLLPKPPAVSPAADQRFFLRPRLR